MTTLYSWWKNIFDYANQPTVILVADSISIVESIPDKTSIGRELQ